MKPVRIEVDQDNSGYVGEVEMAYSDQYDMTGWLESWHIGG